MKLLQFATSSNNLKHFEHLRNSFFLSVSANGVSFLHVCKVDHKSPYSWSQKVCQTFALIQPMVNLHVTQSLKLKALEGWRGVGTNLENTHITSKTVTSTPTRVLSLSQIDNFWFDFQPTSSLKFHNRGRLAVLKLKETCFSDFHHGLLKKCTNIKGNCLFIILGFVGK